MAAALKLNLKLNSAGQSLKFGDEGIQWNLRVACIAVLNDEEWSSLPAGPPAASSARRISTPRRSPSPGWFREVPLDNCIHDASQNHRPGTMNRWWLDYSTFLPAILNDEPWKYHPKVFISINKININHYCSFQLCICEHPVIFHLIYYPCLLLIRVINIDPSNTINRKGSRQCSNSPYPPTICTRYIRTWTRKRWFQIDHNGIEFWRMYTNASFARMHHNQLNWATW